MAGFEGQQFGHYILRKRIGRGHTASVYFAEHIELENTNAAIKVLQSELEEPAAQKIFRREVKILDQLRHPNIIRILDCGFEDAIPYIVMEFAPNGNLDKLHPYKERVANDKIVYYVKHIANALHYAHDHQIIHCDLKPQNVFISRKDGIMVGDFGYARILATTSRHSTHSIEGTWVYMAPEQFTSKPCFASDQYALGVMIYQWLCGTLPFDGPMQSIYHKHIIEEAPPSLIKLAPDLPEEVETVVFKALAKKPEDRYESIQDFADALEKALQPPIVVPEPSFIAIEDEQKAVAQSDVAEAVMIEVQPLTEQTETKAPTALSSSSSIPGNTRGGQKPRWLVLIIGLGLIALGVFLCPFASIKTIQDNYAFYSRATKSIQGVVTDSKITGCSTTYCMMTCTSTIVFQPPQSPPTTFVNSDCTDKGNHVQILYNPTNLKDAKTSEQASVDLVLNIVYAILLWGFCTLLIVAYVFDKSSDGRATLSGEDLEEIKKNELE